MAIIFFPNKIQKIVITNHAEMRSKELGLKDELANLVSAIGQDTQFFFRNARQDSSIKTPPDKIGYVPYVIGARNLRVVFFYSKKLQELIAVTVFKNMEAR